MLQSNKNGNWSSRRGLQTPRLSGNSFQPSLDDQIFIHEPIVDISIFGRRENEMEIGRISFKVPQNINRPMSNLLDFRFPELSQHTSLIHSKAVVNCSNGPRWIFSVSMAIFLLLEPQSHHEPNTEIFLSWNLKLKDSEKWVVLKHFINSTSSVQLLLPSPVPWAQRTILKSKYWLRGTEKEGTCLCKWLMKRWEQGIWQ